MSKLEELEKRLKELEHKRFMIQMIDHWSIEDNRYESELWEQIQNTKREIRQIQEVENV